MTQEQKDLLLKDLCARLPYGVKVQRLSYQIPLKMLSINPNGTTWVTKDTGYPFEVDWEECKPYLFPLSSMTEEQKKEFLSVAGYEIREEDCGRHTETYYYDLVGHERDLYPNTEAIDWCRKNHFDIYGLIPMDLAIDATELNIY